MANITYLSVKIVGLSHLLPIERKVSVSMIKNNYLNS